MLATRSIRIFRLMTRSSIRARGHTLPSWNKLKGYASEVTETLWVLRQKRGANNNEKSKKKARICYNGAMQKIIAARSGTVIETFAPTVHSREK
eukprot:4084199-Prymnesium_polylepis.1